MQGDQTGRDGTDSANDPSDDDTGRRPSWRPAMPRREAERWNAGSAVPGPVYHATSLASAQIIRRDGFDLDYRVLGRTWGNGVYTTPDRGVAEFYARLHEPDAVILELRIRVARPMQVHFPTGPRHDAFR